LLSTKCFFLNFYSLPMMFGSNLKKRIETRCLVDGFGGCSAGIHKFGKKIGSHQILDLHLKVQIFRHPIFLPSLWIHSWITPKRTIKASRFNPHFQTIGSQGRMNFRRYLFWTT
jgi:hypothetical protein